MSQQTTINVDFTEEQPIVEALKEMGFAVEVHPTGKTLSTYYSLGKHNAPTANIIIKQGQRNINYADIGFQKMKDGKYILHGDDMDIRKLNQDRLKQLYTKHFIKQRLQLFGSQYAIAEEVINGNNIKIKIKVSE